MVLLLSTLISVFGFAFFRTAFLAHITCVSLLDVHFTTPAFTGQMLEKDMKTIVLDRCMEQVIKSFNRSPIAGTC